MSQVNATPGPSSSGEPRIHGCRWAWCRLTFLTNADLVHHVIHDHVQSAIPVRRKDIPVLRRTEEGLGESLTTSGFSYTSNCRVTSDTGQKSDILAEPEPSSSLPSPPASSPTSLSPIPSAQDPPSNLAAPLPGCDDSQTSSHGRFYPFDRLSSSPATSLREAPPQASPQPSRVPSPITPQLRLSRPPKSLIITPTFSSLSSPADSPSVRAIPPTPSLSSMVERTTGMKVKRESESPVRALHRKKRSFQSLHESQASQSSSGSHDSVEKQLTQSMNLDDKDEGSTHRPSDLALSQTDQQEYPMVRPNQDVNTGGESEERNLPSHLSQTPSPSLTAPPSQPPPLTVSTDIVIDLNTSSPSSAVAPSRTPRQAWYGTLPPKKSRRSAVKAAAHTKHSAAASGFRLLGSSKPSSPDAIKDSSSVQSRMPGNSTNVFRSGTLQITAPTGGINSNQGEGSPLSQMDSPGWSQSQSQTQSQSEESSLGFSYPPLQTQAPYRSQSFSQ